MAQSKPKVIPILQAQIVTKCMNFRNSIEIGVLFGSKRAVNPAMWPMTVSSPVATTSPKKVKVFIDFVLGWNSAHARSQIRLEMNSHIRYTTLKLTF